jgi:beta-lactam-binding protein with PASTA domain
MAPTSRYFEITQSTPTVKLDTQGRGTVQYKVKNVSAAPVDGRAVLISLPINKPPSGVVQNNWVRIDGAADHHYEKDEQTTFVVKIEVPAKDRTKAGTYTFRLDSVLVSMPDVGDEGPATSFTLEPVKEKQKSNVLAWLIPLILVVVAGIGVGAWLLLRGGNKVPDLTGDTVTDAAAALAKVKMSVDPKIDTTDSSADNADKVVSQDPAPGSKVVENGTVHLTVGAGRATVPALVGQTYGAAQKLLSNAHLAVGVVTNAANPNYSGGVVFAQSVHDGTQVATNTAIDLSVTPQTVTVPDLKGSLINAAGSKLKGVQLQLGNIYCDQLAQPIQSQNPLANTTAPIGTAVDVTVPCTFKVFPGTVFLQKNSVAHQALVLK